jgi:hypothetical protein
MARYEGNASIRRALSMPDGTALLDIRPDGSEWRWASVPADGARVAVAFGIAAISGGWKLYISLPDDPTSGALEIIGLSNVRDRPDPAGAAPGLVLHVVIAPGPRAAARQTYTVTVTDSSATPVDQAVVTVNNFTAAGADDPHTQNTLNGIATFANLTLRSRTAKQQIVTGTGRDREGEIVLVVTPPKLTVAKDGYDTVARNLL